MQDDCWSHGIPVDQGAADETYRPWRVAAAALLFGALDALGLRLQSSGGVDVPYQVFLMLPFVATIVAMAVLARKARAPAALLPPSVTRNGDDR